MGSIRLVIHGLDTRFRVRRTQALRHLVLTNSLADMGMWTAGYGYGKALKVFHKRMDLSLEELVHSIDQSMSLSADISVVVGLFTEEMEYRSS
ncbi:hypothetical protein ARMGADRAFT_1086222 [Armillaria gallica]|uniref:Uncharacterized protein n=1 Tax=Armillaria gallica TaxID=47427 RepID=A0A2H3DEM7_ARMGA|nr:hypothetical protein ARMGADRAFT_1086222 [Armillaria gallica]